MIVVCRSWGRCEMYSLASYKEPSGFWFQGQPTTSEVMGPKNGTERLYNVSRNIYMYVVISLICVMY